MKSSRSEALIQALENSLHGSVNYRLMIKPYLFLIYVFWHPDVVVKVGRKLWEVNGRKLFEISVV